MVSKTQAVEEEFTKKKIFQQDVFAVDTDIKVEFSGTVFGLPCAQADRYIDMRYLSDNEDIPGTDGEKRPILPQLDLGIEKISNNSLLLQDQFSHMTPIHTTLNASRVSKSIPIFSELNIDTKEEFESLPFHIATFFGDTTTGLVVILFHRLSSLRGDIELTATNISVEPSAMARDKAGNSIAFGEIIALRKDSTSLVYILLVKNEAGNNEIRTYGWLSGALDQLETFVGVSEYDDSYQFEHITPLGAADNTCFVGCGPTSRILCLKPSDSGFSGQLDTDTAVTLSDSTNCFQSSSVTLEDGLSMLATASHQNIR